MLSLNTSIASTKRTAKKLPATNSDYENRSEIVRKILLSCGFISSLFYLAINILVPFYFPGYSFESHTVSELSAIGTPTRTLWVLIATVYTLFVAAFGLGVWESAGRNRCLSVVGGLMFVYGIIGIFWPPMHQRQALAAGERTLTDTMHIIFTMATVVLMLLSIGFAAAALGKLFRVYSIITIVVLLLFGAMTGSAAPRLEANLPTPGSEFGSVLVSQHSSFGYWFWRMCFYG